MNLVVTGKIQSGKSTWCSAYSSRLARKGFSVGGVVCPTVIDNDSKIGCNAYDLQTSESTIFARLLSLANFPGESVGRYMISHEGLSFAENAIQKALGNRCDAIFIDEIGSLELAEKGLFDIATTAYQSAACTITVVRKNLLPSFLHSFRQAGVTVQYKIKDLDAGMELYKSLPAK